MEVQVNATKAQIKDFKDSLLWGDILRELEMWKRGCKEEPLNLVDNASETNPSTATVLMHLGDISGRVKAIEYFKGILDIFLTVIEENNDDIECE